MGRSSFASALASSFVVTTLRRRRHLGGLRRRSSTKGLMVLRRQGRKTCISNQLATPALQQVFGLLGAALNHCYTKRPFPVGLIFGS
ncbi:hypothetical protein OPV22_000189 [Ensete ventricosum]|uniref:Uncharacterized protein n=1 Tax=Ensete ventricosum TaxID=4639 RepID=A0AAV8RUA6_ENSVE|nr:hypothetical protein OPV22_000189 [Ensete ventricosum]